MRKPLIAVLAALVLTAALPSVATAVTVKSAVKVGAKCSKSGARAKAGSVPVVCKRNAKKVLVWTKYESAACKEAKADQAEQLKMVADVKKQIADFLASGVPEDQKKSITELMNTMEDAVKELTAKTALLCSK